MKKSSSIKKGVNIAALLVVIDICAVKVYAAYSGNFYFAESSGNYNCGIDETNGWLVWKGYWNGSSYSNSGKDVTMYILPEGASGRTCRFEAIDPDNAQSVSLGYRDSTSGASSDEGVIQVYDDDEEDEDKIVFEMDGDVCIVLQ